MNNIKIYNKNSYEIVNKLDIPDLLVLDPPFQDWEKIDFKIPKWLAVLGKGKGKERSMSFDGISNAFGDQWGDENRLPIPVEQLSLF